MEKIKLKKPTLILVAGSPCSGKTQFCRNLPQYICDLAYIEKDIIMKTFLRQHGENDGLDHWRLSASLTVEDHFYSEHVRDQTYECMFQLALNNLGMGNNSLMESSYIKEIMNGYIDNAILPRLEGFGFKLLLFYAPEEVIKSRVIQRKEARDASKLRDDAAFHAWLNREPVLPEQIKSYDHLLIDTTNPYDQNLKKVLDYLTK